MELLHIPRPHPLGPNLYPSILVMLLLIALKVTSLKYSYMEKELTELPLISTLPLSVLGIQDLDVVYLAM